MSHRFPLWSALTVSSIVSLAAIVSHVDDDRYDQSILGLSSDDFEDQDKWVTSVAAISAFLGLVGSIAYLFLKDKFKGTPIEGGVAIVVLGMWAAAFPALLDPNHALATIGDNRGIYNANIFFFSWASFIFALMITAVFAMDYIQSTKSTFAHFWLYCCAASLVVMTSSIRLWIEVDCDTNSMDGTDYCKRTTFAIALGLVSAVLSIPLMVLTHETLQLVGSMIMFIIWCFGASYFTFESGPAIQAGTLYFSTWAALFLTLYITSALLHNKFIGHEEASTQTTADRIVDAVKPEPDNKLGHHDDESEDVENH